MADFHYYPPRECISTKVLKEQATFELKQNVHITFLAVSHVNLMMEYLRLTISQHSRIKLFLYIAHAEISKKMKYQNLYS